jgi:hypothetical protein
VPNPDYIYIASELPPTWSIDAAQPAVSPVNTDPAFISSLTWSGSNSISPIARLTDTRSLDALQNWLIVAGVGMGIGGAMLASLLFERLGPRSTVSRVVDQQNGPVAPSVDHNSRDFGERTVDARRSRFLAILGVAILIGFAKRYHTRRHARLDRG